MTPDFTIDRSGKDDVIKHLHACDASFRPPLAERVDLDAYAGKLVQNAARFEAWAGGRLVGLVAVYCNVPDSDTAFVSNVSVLPVHTGQGIARHLMQVAIDHARALGFAELTLKVDRRAIPALRLYDGLGFRQDDDRDADTQAMTLPLRAR